MRISERHADLAVTEQPRDHRKRDAVEDRLRGDAVAKVMQAHVLDFGLFSHQLPYSVKGVHRTGLLPVDGGRKDPWTIRPGLAFDDGFCFRAEKHCPGTGLTVHKFQDVLAHLAPLQIQNLAAPASGEQKEADDIGRWSAHRTFSHAGVKHRVKAADFLPGKKPSHLPSRVPPDAPGRIGCDMPADYRMIQDP